MALDMKGLRNVVFMPENVAQFVLYAYYANIGGEFEGGKNGHVGGHGKQRHDRFRLPMREGSIGIRFSF